MATGCPFFGSKLGLVGRTNLLVSDVFRIFHSSPVVLLSQVSCHEATVYCLKLANFNTNPSNRTKPETVRPLAFITCARVPFLRPPSSGRLTYIELYTSLDTTSSPHFKRKTLMIFLSRNVHLKILKLLRQPVTCLSIRISPDRTTSCALLSSMRITCCRAIVMLRLVVFLSS